MMMMIIINNTLCLQITKVCLETNLGMVWHSFQDPGTSSQAMMMPKWDSSGSSLNSSETSKMVNTKILILDKWHSKTELSAYFP
jgi:hypothetical protein